MKPRFVLLCVLATVMGTAVAVFPAQPPQVKPETKFVVLPDGSRAPLVNREKMRTHKTTKKFSLPPPLKDLPGIPDTFDYTKMKNGTAISFPILGNNQYGDCYYVAPLHLIQSTSGVSGNKQVVFDEKMVINRYLKVSGGDNGLSDDDIYPEWKAGLVGPQGPYKLIDYATVDPGDIKSVKFAMYHCGGVLTTHSLRTTWESGIKAGMIWDATGRIDPYAGHAVHQAGVDSRGYLMTQTWGLQVFLTPAGLANSDAEVIVCISPTWFDAAGFTPNGTHYDEISNYWYSATGRKLPQGLYPPPVTPPGPPIPPNPPVPVTGGFTGVETATTTWKDGWKIGPTVYTSSTSPMKIPNVDSDTHEIDLSTLGPIRRAIAKRKIVQLLEDNEHGDYAVKGDKIIITRKAGVDWNAFLDFLTKLLPIILQIISLFGSGAEPTSMIGECRYMGHGLAVSLSAVTGTLALSW